MSVLIGFTSQEYEGSDHNGNTSGSPQVALRVGGEAEVPGNKVEATISQDDDEEQDTVLRCANDRKSIICEARQGPLPGSSPEMEMRLNFC